MKLAPPPDIAYDEDLKTWLHKLAVTANREGNFITVDLNTPRVTIENTAHTTEDTSSNNHPPLLHVFDSVCAYGYLCRQGYGGTLGANVFNFNWTGAALNAYADNTLLGAVTLTSDYRLKHQVQDLAVDALARINNLRPVTFRWRDVDIWQDDGKTREGLIAHEVAEAIPGAVVGEKDDNDGKKDKYQYIDIMQLFPTLVKGIQELSTIVNDQAAVIADLQRRVDQLERRQP